MRHIRAYLVAAICIAAGCSFTPEVPSSATTPVGEEWPDLLPASEIAGLEAQLDGRSEVLAQEASDLASRVAALKAKANDLDRPILSDQERARLLQAASDGI